MTNFVLVTFAKSPIRFSCTGYSPRERKNQMRVQNPPPPPAEAVYCKLPIVCVAFLFELVTSCSASKCPYYQKGVNTFSKVIVCSLNLLTPTHAQLYFIKKHRRIKKYNYITDMLPHHRTWYTYNCV